MNEHINIQTDEMKDENYIPLCINAEGIKKELGHGLNCAFYLHNYSMLVAFLYGRTSLLEF